MSSELAVDNLEPCYWTLEPYYWTFDYTSTQRTCVCTASCSNVCFYFGVPKADEEEMCFTAKVVRPAACGFGTRSQTEAISRVSLRDIRSWLQEQALTSGWSYPFHFLGFLKRGLDMKWPRYHGTATTAVRRDRQSNLNVGPLWRVLFPEAGIQDGGYSCHMIKQMS
jgi:hypothetical protein